MWVKKVFVFFCCLMPFALFVYWGISGDFGPDPGKELTLYLGHTSIVMLILVLALPILNKFPALSWLKKCSRQIGLWVFFYVTMHLITYAAFFTGFNASVLFEDLTQRPYVYVGVIAWFILFLMTLTSNRFFQKMLKRRWKFLHRLVYVAVVAALVHILWVARSDAIWFVLYTCIVIFIVSVKFRKQFCKCFSI